MSAFERAESVADVLTAAVEHETPTAAEIDELRADLTDGLRDAVEGWDDRPAGPLRVNKARMRSTALCPAQVLAETEPYELGGNLVVGTICDIAAGMVAVHPGFAADGDWYDRLAPTLAEEKPEIVAYVEQLGPDDREMLLADIDERCTPISSLLGDLRHERMTVRERVTVDVDEARVLLAAEIDLVVGPSTTHAGRVLIEVKSGSFGLSIPDEIRHYGLLMALRDGIAPSAGCAIALRDATMTPIPLRLVDLQTAARRLVATAEHLVAIDCAVGAGTPVETAPGDHCRWCRRVRACDAVSERILAELPATPNITTPITTTPNITTPTSEDDADDECGGDDGLDESVDGR